MLNNISPIKKAIVLIAFSSQFNLALSATVPTSACDQTGYTVGFFNGVWNTKAQADDSRDSLRKLKGDVLNKEIVKYITFYNITGAANGATSMQDLAATFIQRADAIDATGELGKHFEYVWESLTGEKTLTQKLIDIFPTSLSFFSSLYTYVSSQVMAGLSRLLSNPPTEEKYLEHNAQLDELLANNQKMMLVAHSQGNLFANHAYDYIMPKAGVDSVKLAHIAPASPTLRGEYVLADIDVVINGLRVQGINSVPPINITLPFSTSDASGHTLVGTYLDETRIARAAVSAIISTAMNALIPPQQCKPVAAICPDMFTQTQLAQVKPNMTVADVDQVFACQHQGGTTGSNWVFWSSPAALFRTDLDMAFVYFTNGVYLGNKVNDKYIVGPINP